MTKVGEIVQFQFWLCSYCGATAPLRKQYPAPDTSMRLGIIRRNWLIARYGGVTNGVKRLIDNEIDLEE